MELSIEAASDDVGIALSVDGVVGLSATWVTERNHSVELLPNIDRMLTEAGRTKADVSAVFIDLGPGGYAGLRVSVSIAKALAHGLGVPMAGVGRLEVDAWSVAGELPAGTRVVAVHRAGRGEVAWAAYRSGDWREEMAPHITRTDALRDAITSGDAVTGDIDDDLATRDPACGCARCLVAQPSRHCARRTRIPATRRRAGRRCDGARAAVPARTCDRAAGRLIAARAHRGVVFTGAHRRHITLQPRAAQPRPNPWRRHTWNAPWYW